MLEKPGRMTRREFLRDIGRYGVALLLGGGVGALMTRNSEECINQGICRGCGAFEACHLPQALSAKRAGASEGEQCP